MVKFMMETPMRPFLTALLVLAPGLVAAQTPSAGSIGASQPVLQARMADPAGAPVQPPAPPPTDVIPPVPENPAPPAEQPSVVSQQPNASGQWVYTNQYGWVWMPYGNAYTYVPPTGDVPDMYVYYPNVGWSWVVAPWVWGWGPSPYFGAFGTVGFGWYGVGFGRWYGYAGPYAGWRGRGFYNGGRWYGGTPFHPAGARGGGFSSGGARGAGPSGGAHSAGGGGGHGGGGHR
jgi:hypothetical protein